MNETAQYPRFRWLILIAAVTGYISMQIILLSFAPILPQIALDIEVDMGTATNLMTAFVFSGAIALLFAGIICDRYGIMVVTLIGLFFAAAPATFMPWFGTTYHGAFWMRILGGFSTGFLLSAYGPIVAIWFPPREKGLAAGLLGSSVGIGSAIGVIIGPALFLVTGDWRHISAWLSILPWIGLIFTAILFIVPNPPLPPQSQFDEVNLANKSALKQAFLSPTTWIGVLVIFFAAWCFQTLTNFTPAFFSADKPAGAGFGPMVAGQLMLSVMVASIIGPVIGGIITDRGLRGNVNPVITVCFAFSCMAIYAIQSEIVYTSTPFLVLVLLVAGLAVSCVYASILLYIAKVYPVQVVGKMTGLWSAIGAFGGSIGILVAGLSVKNLGNYRLGIIITAIGGLVGLVLALFLPKTKG